MDANRISPANPREMNEKIFNEKTKENWLQEQYEPTRWEDNTRHELRSDPRKQIDTTICFAKHPLAFVFGLQTLGGTA